MSDLSVSDLAKAARNEGYDTFELKNPTTGEAQTFELKHLGYDDYLEFCSLVKPILTALSSGLDMGDRGGEFKLQFNPMDINYDELIGLAGKQLPRMAWLCCKQSAPKITIDKVKQLGHRPQTLLTVVLKQIKHNDMVKEFADFFPLIVEQVTALLPAAQEVMQPAPMETTAPTE